MSLEVSGLSMRFGGVRALERVSFQMAQGEALGLIGPNGAGKSTLLNLLSRFFPPAEGGIRWQGVDLLRYPPEALAALGLARTFQTPQLFPGLTVCQHVVLGGYSRLRGGLLAAALALPGLLHREARLRDEATSLLEEWGLGDVAEVEVSALPFGLRKRLELVRALAARPRLLLLDEPGAGLSPEERVGLIQALARVRHQGIGLLLVEHNMEIVQALCDRVLVLNFGSLIAEGPPEEVLRQPEVVAAYLGNPGGGSDAPS